MKIFWIILSFFCIISTLIPFLNINHWVVRMFDFPHAQLTFLTFVGLIITCFFIKKNEWLTIGLSLSLALVFIYQVTLIYRYTPLKTVESIAVTNQNLQNKISLLSANVLMTNRKPAALIAEIEKENPDIVILLEVDEWWIEQVAFLKETYPFFVEKPIENLYGLAVYSKMKWENPTVKYLIEENIPSLEATVFLPSGKEFDLHVLHPKPPSPQGNEESTERDAELLLVGTMVKKRKRPAIVIGDLNDVAWSKTTRLFQKISGLLDPRIGRGFFNTFHADFPFLRWPLDHAFHSKHFKLCTIKRLPYIHSDHFPIFVKLQYESSAKFEQTAPTATQKEEKKAARKIQKAQ